MCSAVYCKFIYAVYCFLLYFILGKVEASSIAQLFVQNEVHSI